jgi:PhnB protein|nr:VOC family protein [uncultured Pedobacter sp.]
MATVNAYLMFDGNCEAVFNFYKSVFGKEFSSFSRFGEIPAEEKMPALDEEGNNRVMHVSLPISAETILMGSDIMPGMGMGLTVGDNFSVAIGASSKEEADQLFTALSEGGKVKMPIEMTFWNAYFGMLTDKFGINWMVNFDLIK